MTYLLCGARRRRSEAFVRYCKMMGVLKQCAAVILVNERGQVLFVFQERGRYGFPGGVVDVGETPPMAAFREAKEEANVEVGLEYIVGTYFLRGGGLPDIFATVYKGCIRSGTLKPDGREIIRLAWRDPRHPPTPLLSDAKAALPDFLAGRRGAVRDYWR